MKAIEAATLVVLKEADRIDSHVFRSDAEAVARAMLLHVRETLDRLITVDDSPEHNQAVLDCIYEFEK